MHFFHIGIILMVVLPIFFGLILWIRRQRKSSATYRTQAEQQDVLIQMILRDEQALARLMAAERQKRPDASEKELRQHIMYRLQSGQRHIPVPQGKQHIQGDKQKPGDMREEYATRD